VKKVLTEEMDGDMSRKAAVMARVTAVSIGDRDFRAPTRSKGKRLVLSESDEGFRQSKASKFVQERSPLYRG
jgi:hypothetical protein